MSLCSDRWHTGQNVGYSLADMLCLTEIDAEAPQVDAYFPAVESAIWHEKSRESHLVDEKHPCPYAFVDYIHK